MAARALELAARGRGQVSPSPLVGCVVVDGAGEVAGEGFYLYERKKHAEVLALEEAGERARGATAYVSLEPHAHHGRTPPCTEALINAGVRRVVAPIEDPNPLVSGRGFERLREAGVETCVGLLASEAARLNEKYIHAHRRGLPFVQLKLAVSLDGRIATREGDARWLTGEEARRRVHLLRHEYDAILVGAGTVEHDDPSLTDRSGLARRRPLIRIVLDERLTLSPRSKLAQTVSEAPVIVFTSESVPRERSAPLEDLGIEIVRCASGGREIEGVLRELHERDVQGLLVEGGSRVAAAFLRSGAVCKASFFIAPLILGGDALGAVGGQGAAKVADALRLRDVETARHGDDVEVTGYLDREAERED